MASSLPTHDPAIQKARRMRVLAFGTATFSVASVARLSAKELPAWASVPLASSLSAGSQYNGEPKQIASAHERLIKRLASESH